jgi:hypothetical protein
MNLSWICLYENLKLGVEDLNTHEDCTCYLKIAPVAWSWCQAFDLPTSCSPVMPSSCCRRSAVSCRRFAAVFVTYLVVDLRMQERASRIDFDRWVPKYAGYFLHHHQLTKYRPFNCCHCILWRYFLYFWNNFAVSSEMSNFNTWGSCAQIGTNARLAYMRQKEQKYCVEKKIVSPVGCFFVRWSNHVTCIVDHWHNLLHERCLRIVELTEAQRSWTTEGSGRYPTDFHVCASPNSGSCRGRRLVGDHVG